MSEAETMNETLNIVEEYVSRHQPQAFRLERVPSGSTA